MDGDQIESALTPGVPTVITGGTYQIAPQRGAACVSVPCETSFGRVQLDISVVKALLGHRSLKATQKYTHISARQISKTSSPLDLLGTPAAEIFG